MSKQILPPGLQDGAAAQLISSLLDHAFRENSLTVAVYCSATRPVFTVLDPNNELDNFGVKVELRAFLLRAEPALGPIAWRTLYPEL